MDLQIMALPVLQSNFIYIGISGKDCFVVDPGVSDPVLSLLKQQGLNLRSILITHEHQDHIGGVLEILEEFPVDVFLGPKSLSIAFNINQKIKNPNLVHPIHIGESFVTLNQKFQVLDGRGHTSEMVLFYNSMNNLLFSGDLIFHMGCGRIFDGTYVEHFNSLEQLKVLPEQTKIYCSHDYSEMNLNFCLQNGFAALARDYPQAHKIPICLKFERQFNPFLKCRSASEFKKIRDLRDLF